MAHNSSRHTVPADIPVTALAADGLATLAVGADAELLELGARHDAARAILDEFNKTPDDYPDDYEFPDTPIVRKIALIRATTAAGLKIKARALFCEMGWLTLDDDDDDTQTAIARSLIRDIVAL
ncbi:MAG: hypothetical protein WDN46_19600 [Methylocella sp.]